MTQLQPDMEDLRRRERRLQRRRIVRRAVVGVLVSGLLAAGIIAPLTVLRSISGDEDRSQPGATGATPTESPSPELATFSDPEDRLSIQAPSDWHFDTNPVPNLVNPKIDFAVGSWAFPVAEGCGPNEALAELPPDGTLIWVEEYDVSDIGPEVDNLFDPTLEDAVFGDELVQGECANAVPYYVLYFHEGQRAFVVSAAFGSLTGAEEQDAALQMVRSIRVDE